DDGVADEVGEGDFAAAPAGEVVVHHDAVVHQQLGRDGTHARGGGDLETGLHIGHHARGGAAEPDRAVRGRSGVLLTGRRAGGVGGAGRLCRRGGRWVLGGGRGRARGGGHVRRRCRHAVHGVRAGALRRGGFARAA